MQFPSVLWNIKKFKMKAKFEHQHFFFKICTLLIRLTQIKVYQLTVSVVLWSTHGNCTYRYLIHHHWPMTVKLTRVKWTWFCIQFTRNLHAMKLRIKQEKTHWYWWTLVLELNVTFQWNWRDNRQVTINLKRNNCQQEMISFKTTWSWIHWTTLRWYVVHIQVIILKPSILYLF